MLVCLVWPRLDREGDFAGEDILSTMIRSGLYEPGYAISRFIKG